MTANPPKAIMTAEQRAQLHQWVDEHGDALFRYAYSRVRNESVAEDLVQITFMAATTAIANFEGKSSPKTWLTGILKHKILDHFRKQKRDALNDELPSMEELFHSSFNEKGHWAADAPDWTLNPEQLLDHDELRSVLKKCIGALPEASRQLFVLREMDGLGTQELCETLGLSVSNLNVTIHRIRHRLRDCFTKNGIQRYAPL